MLVTACCASLALAMSDKPAVQAQRFTYHGWTNSLRLSNRSAEIVIVPRIGRIMRFAPIGGPNVLWENPQLLGSSLPPASQQTDWLNFGGDKLWPAPQSRWGWPPDPYLDGSPWSARVRGDDSVEMLSPISPSTKLQFRRRVVLHEHDASVTIRNELINRGEDAVEWSVWEVAQVADPDWADMRVGKPSIFRDGFRIFPDNPAPADSVVLMGERVRARRHAGSPYKIGADPLRTELRAQVSGWLFTVTGPNRGRDQYPDEGCSVEIFSNPDPLPYMELEALSPVVRLSPRGQVALTTRWTLTRAQRR